VSDKTDIVYLDYAASTPVDPRVIEVMTPLFGVGGDFANPSSGHVAGRRSQGHVARAAEQLAGLLGCSERELVWTSGATESDNLAIAGAARYRADRGRHLVTMPVPRGVRGPRSCRARDGDTAGYAARVDHARQQ
jgi:cysteine desulfurase